MHGSYFAFALFHTMKTVAQSRRIDLLRSVFDQVVARDTGSAEKRDGEAEQLVSFMYHALEDEAWRPTVGAQLDSCEPYRFEVDEAIVAQNQERFNHWVFQEFSARVPMLPLPMKTEGSDQCTLFQVRWDLYAHLLHVWATAAGDTAEYFRKTAGLAGHREEESILLRVLRKKVEQGVVSEERLFSALVQSVTGERLAPRIVLGLFKTLASAADISMVGRMVELFAPVHGCPDAYDVALHDVQAAVARHRTTTAEGWS